MSAPVPSQTVIAAIEAVAPPAAAAPWDHSGVQFPGIRAEVASLAVCLEPSPVMIQAALASGADFICSHHPVSMAPQFFEAAPPAYQNAARLVLSAGAWLYSAHTSLDASPAGPASWLAEELGLFCPSVLETTWRDPADYEYGFGLVGDLPEPLSFVDFCARLRDLTHIATLSVSGTRPDSVRRVGICGGSGSALAPRAFAAGADVLITGDVKYHTALESPLCLLDVGHFCIEEEMMRRLSLHLQADLPALRVFFLPGANPISSINFKGERL